MSTSDSVCTKLLSRLTRLPTVVHAHADQSPDETMEQPEQEFPPKSATGSVAPWNMFLLKKAGAFLEDSKDG